MEPRVTEVTETPTSHRPDSGATAPRLPAEGERALQALWGALRSGNGVPRERLRGVARVVGPAARADGLRAEQVIVAVKESWSRGVDSEHVRDPLALRGVLADLISLCVAEYFREPGSGTRAQ